MKTQREWEDLIRQRVVQNQAEETVVDPAHDLAHFERVVKTARQLCEEEGADESIVMPAAWLHDLINVPKNDPRRSQASRLSGEAAVQYLSQIHYPAQALEPIRHAIEAHSYSAKIEAKTLEAKVVQDADRLDGLGAIGIARCFAVSGLLHRKLYCPEDPLGKTRKPEELNDLEYAVDHFFVKLFNVVDSLQTEAGKKEGQRRAQFMRSFLNEMGTEIHGASL